MTDLIERAKAVQAKLGYCCYVTIPEGFENKYALKIKFKGADEAAAIIGELIALVEAGNQSIPAS